LEKKLANELKAKEQLQLQIEILLKLIQVNHSEFERIFKVRMHGEVQMLELLFAHKPLIDCTYINYLNIIA